MASVSENLAPQALRSIVKELKHLTKNPIEDVNVHINDDNISDVQATIKGPASTPYEGGVFRMKLIMSSDFPQSPPKGFFITKIFHPNVAETGDICVNTLKRDWKPEYGIEHILTVIKCLLIHPNPASALNEEAGKLLLEDYVTFAKRAKMMTEVHARPVPSSDGALLESDPSATKVTKKKKAAKKKSTLKRL
jgi:ubiquitin-conjugating enzyme E2 S